MNRVCISGPMAQAPKNCTQPGGNPIARFTVAVKHYGKLNEGERDCYFIDCTAFGQSAAFLLEYGNTGDTVVVDGRLEKRKHEEQWYTTVIADNVDLAKGKEGE